MSLCFLMIDKAGSVCKFKETLFIESNNIGLRERPVEEDCISDLYLHNGSECYVNWLRVLGPWPIGEWCFHGKLYQCHGESKGASPF